MSKKAKMGSLAKSSPFAASKRPSIAPIHADTSAVYPAAVPEASGSENRQNVVVCVRMRPSRSDHSDKEDIWSCDKLKNQIIPTDLHPAIAKRTTSSERAGASLPTLLSTHDFDQDDPSSSTSTYNFQFDKLVCEGEDTDDMYNSHISPVVKAAVEGYNGTVFAYGQTGSGKTHTMSGSPTEPGVIPRAVQQVFAGIRNEPEREFLLRVSYLEIYNETLKDLLAPLPPTAGASSLQMTDRPASPIKGGSSHAAGQSQSSVLRIIEDQKQNRVVITGLREEIVTDAETVLDLIHRGQEERHVGATDWNERSSRSHCVFQLTVESRSKATEAAGGKEVRVSQLNLIDLAGSERAASQAERRKEGAFINKSLLTLGTVIGKLTEPCDSGDAHIPYRDSKLTRILQTSLAGNARIAVICTLSPDLEHANETLSTLKFGKRCKLVVTTAKKGVNMDDKALLQKYRKELDALRARLEANSSQMPDLSTITDSAGESSADSELAQQRLDELKHETQLAEQQVSDMQKKRTDLKTQIDHLTRLILTSHSVARESDPIAAAEALESAGAPGTPVRRRAAHAPALTRRGPRMSDFNALFTPAPSNDESSTLSGAKPFELEAELASLRRQLRQQLELRQSLSAAHEAELAARDAAQAELKEAIRLNEEQLDKAELACDQFRQERDDARKAAEHEQQLALEQRTALLAEQEANRALHVEAQARADEQEKALQTQISALEAQLTAKEAKAEEAKLVLQKQLAEVTTTLEAQLAAVKQAHESETTAKAELESQLTQVKAAFEAQLKDARQAHELETTSKVEVESQLAQVKATLEAQLADARQAHESETASKSELQSQLTETKAALEAKLADVTRAHESESANKVELQSQLTEVTAALEAKLTDITQAHESESAAKLDLQKRLTETAAAFEAQLADAKQAHEAETAAKRELQSRLDEQKATLEVKLAEISEAHELTTAAKLDIEARLAQVHQAHQDATIELEATKATLASTADEATRGAAASDTLLQQTKEQAEIAAKLQTELDSAKQALLDKEQATTSKVAELDVQVQSLQDQLSQSKQDKDALQTEIATLRASNTKHEQELSEMSALQSNLAQKEAKIADLEKELVVEREKAAKSPAKTVESPVSTMKGFAVSRLRDASSTNSAPTTPTDAVKGHSRAGSVKEYRRYQPTVDSADVFGSPSQAALATRSVLLGHRATFDTSRSNLALNASSTKAEKEEIERLNAVINSQRAIMADLEKSVASWKTQMHAQAQLINQLVLNNGGAQSAVQSPAAEKPALSELSHNTYDSPPVRRKALFDKFAADDDHSSRVYGSLPRTTHLNLATNPRAEPYYGAHSYNRPPISTGSPHKKLDFSASTWSGTSGAPTPLPLPTSESLTSSPSRTLASPSKRKPRKTIEMDLQLLNASPRVETNIKNKFCFDSPHNASQDTPTKRRATNTSSYYI